MMKLLLKKIGRIMREGICNQVWGWKVYWFSTC